MASEAFVIHRSGQDDFLLPDYLPARMVNEFVYCPRLFFYEWVEGIFRESADTLEGSVQHQRVDREGGELPPADEIAEDGLLKTQAITLSSERLRVVAKMDVVQVDGGVARPIDYKRGRPMESDSDGGGLRMWPADRVQIVLQAIILRENGYRCDEAIVYYRSTNQRVRIAITDEVVLEAEAAVESAWRTAQQRLIPVTDHDIYRRHSQIVRRPTAVGDRSQFGTPCGRSSR